jgi:hypothetical protein
MSTLELIVEQARDLPLDRQREVLDFIGFLRARREQHRPSRKSVYGVWRGLGVDVSEEDIATVRREMWGSFPRRDV